MNVDTQSQLTENWVWLWARARWIYHTPQSHSSVKFLALFALPLLCLFHPHSVNSTIYALSLRIEPMLTVHTDCVYDRIHMPSAFNHLSLFRCSFVCNRLSLETEPQYRYIVDSVEHTTKFHMFWQTILRPKICICFSLNRFSSLRYVVHILKWSEVLHL